jgi:hypothetical protein
MTTAVAELASSPGPIAAQTPRSHLQQPLADTL